MISSFRREVKKYSGLMYFIVIMLALPSSLAWLVMGPSSSQRKPVATVNGIPVDFNNYHKAFSELQSQITMIKSYARNYGFSDEAFLKNMLGNKTPQKIALDRCINDTLIDSVGASHKIAIDADLFKTMLIETMPQDMIDEQGTINMDTYQSYLQRLSLTPLQFEKSKELEFEREVIGDILSKTLYISEKELEAMYLKHQGLKSFEIMRIPFEPFVAAQKKAGASDEQLSTFYQRVQESYRLPEKRTVVTWSMPISDYEGHISVDQEAVRQFYEKNKSTLYRIKPKVKLRTLVLKEDSQDVDVKKILTLVKDKPNDFVTLIKKHSIDEKTKEHGGIVDFFTRGTYEDAAFESAAFKLKEVGEFSEPIKTKKGIEILQLVERVNAQEKPFDDVREEIKKSIQAKRSINELRGMIEHIMHDLKKGDNVSLEKFIEEFNLSSKEKEEVVGMHELKSPGFRGTLAQNIFKTRPEVPYGYVSNEGLFVIFNVKSIEKSSIPELKTVKDKVLEAYYKELAQESLQKTTSQLSEQVLSGDDLKKIASGSGYDYKVTDKLNRRSAPKGLHDIAGAATKLFGLSDPKQLMQLTAKNNDRLFVRLVTVEKDEKLKNVKEEKKLKEQELSKQNKLFVNAIIASLRKVATIETDEDVLKQFSHSR